MRCVCNLQIFGLFFGFADGLSISGGFPTRTDDSFLSLPHDDNGVSWEEVIIPPPISSSKVSEELVGSNVGERIRFGESVLLLKDLVDAETCHELVQLVRQSQNGNDDSKPGLLRVPTIAAAKRALRNKTPCADPMCSKADSICNAILLRALSCIDQDQPSIPMILFPNLSSSMADVFRTDMDATSNHQYQWSSREPAVNVYTAGGEFLAHTDSQSLTILVALTEPLKDGGTAFWSQDSRGHRVEGPSLILRPPVGTALLFGGCVTHAGMPITDGLRSVLVASFS